MLKRRVGAWEREKPRHDEKTPKSALYNLLKQECKESDADIMRLEYSMC